jgi:hypothetical protein
MFADEWIIEKWLVNIFIECTVERVNEWKKEWMKEQMKERQYFIE